MATLTLASLWLSSLLLIGSLGWIMGQWGRQTNSPPSQLASTGADAQPIEAVCTSPVLTPTGEAKQRARLFDTMPPIESVRAQARLILQTEDVWSDQDAQLQASGVTLNCASVKRDPMHAPAQLDQPASSSTLV